MLIAIEEARRIVLEHVRPLDSERVRLDAAAGRVLAEDVTSAIDVPPFDSSAMDGFALVAGAAAELELVGEARAGHPWDDPVRPGTAVRISTGAAVPPGASAVIPVERTRASDSRVRVEETAEGANIRRAGEDVRAGDVVLERGMRLGPAELGVAASVGRAELLCSRTPRVALLVTGDELVTPGLPLEPGLIYSSNGYALAAQVQRAGGELVGWEMVRDSAEGTRDAIAGALDAADMVIVSGGVSVGPHDHVKGALRELGVEERFWGVSLRPGKPTWFGTRRERARLRPAREPGFRDGDLSALRPPRSRRPAGRRPRGAACKRPARRGGRAQPTPRAGGARTPAPRRGRPARGPTGEQGSHILTSMVGADGPGPDRRRRGRGPGG